MTRKCGFSEFMLLSIPGTIWAIGISSLLINIATSVSFAGTALYLKAVCGVSIGAIGCVEATVEALAYAIRMLSGVISDYFRKRKTLMLLGFAMIVISKPILTISKTYLEILLARGIDRIGNGIQASPRDALISDAAPSKSKGACFGLRQSLALIGSTLGGAFGVIVMKLSGNNFKVLFILATIPAAIAVATLALFVREGRRDDGGRAGARYKIKLRDIGLLGKSFWLLMIITGVLMLGRFSEVFISLHACGNFNLDIAYGTAITVIYNLTSTAVSYPIGKLSDRIGRTRLLLIGFATLFLAHVSMGFAVNLQMVLFGTVLWGCQRGITDGLLATMIADYVPKELRGTGFGMYYFVVSLSTAIASAVAGMIAQLHGEACAFIMGACFCSAAAVLLYAFRNRLHPD
jgi:MFS family permease